MAMDTIVLAAMVMLLVGGMFDLSVDGVVNMAGVITGALLVAGAGIPVAIAAGVAAAWWSADQRRCGNPTAR